MVILEVQCLHVGVVWRRGTKTRPQRQNPFSEKWGRLSCTDGSWKVQRKDDVPTSGLAGTTWSLGWCCRLPKLVGTMMSLRACPTDVDDCPFPRMKRKRFSPKSIPNSASTHRIPHGRRQNILIAGSTATLCPSPPRRARANQIERRPLAPKHTCRRRASRALSAKVDQRQALQALVLSA